MTYLSNEHHSPKSLLVVLFPPEILKVSQWKKLKQSGLLPAELGAADSWAVQYTIHVLTLPLDDFFPAGLVFMLRGICLSSEGEV